MSYLNHNGFRYFWETLRPHIIYSGVCSTAGSTQTKQVDTTPKLINYWKDPIPENAQIRVKFSNQNTANEPYLSVDGTRQRPIVDPHGVLNTPERAKNITGYCTFVYDKDNEVWVLISSEKSQVDRIIYTEGPDPTTLGIEPFEGMIWLKKKPT